MKTVSLLLLCLFFFSSPAFAGWVNGYTRSDGTYVKGHYRSDSDSTVKNNYDYEGNTNPYTGTKGHNHYRHSKSSEYYQGY